MIDQYKSRLSSLGEDEGELISITSPLDDHHCDCKSFKVSSPKQGRCFYKN